MQNSVFQFILQYSLFPFLSCSKINEYSDFICFFRSDIFTHQEKNVIHINTRTSSQHSACSQFLASVKNKWKTQFFVCATIITNSRNCFSLNYVTLFFKFSLTHKQHSKFNSKSALSIIILLKTLNVITYILLTITSKFFSTKFDIISSLESDHNLTMIA